MSGVASIDVPPEVAEGSRHWTERFLKSILFVIVALAGFGV